MNHFPCSRRFRILNAFGCVLLLAAIGCSNSSTPSSNNNNNSAAITKPKQGSTFVDSVCYKDTSLNIIGPGQLIVYRVSDTNATFNGKSNVYVIVSTTLDTHTHTYDTIYQHYESNGDLSVYVPFSAGGFAVGSEWITFPFASQGNSNIPTLQTVVIDTVTLAGSVTGSGSGSQTINGTSTPIEKATMNATATSGLLGSLPATVIVSFAPSIGLVTYQDVTVQGQVSSLSLNLSGGSRTYFLSFTT